MKLVVAPGIEIPEEEVSAEYSRASGPGGQHVNKTESRVVLRFPIADSPSIPEPHKTRMMGRLRPRITKAGELLVACESHRDRSENVREAFERLEQMLIRAFEIPKPRKKTRPSRGAKERRLEAKRRTGGKKRTRKAPSAED